MRTLNVLCKFYCALIILVAVLSLSACQSEDNPQGSIQPQGSRSAGTTPPKRRAPRPVRTPLGSSPRSTGVPSAAPTTGSTTTSSTVSLSSPIPSPVLSPSTGYSHPVISYIYGPEPTLLQGFSQLNVTDHPVSGFIHQRVDSVVIDSRIDYAHRMLMIKDLRHLETLSFDQTHASAQNLRNLIQVPTLAGAALKRWFESKVQIIFAHYLWKYPGPGLLGYNFLDDVFRKATYSVHRPGILDFNSATDFNVNPPDGINPVKSVIKLYPQLMDENSSSYPGIDYSRSLVRLAIMLHEAVHSSGNHAHHSFSMLHVACPSGHASAGSLACDRFTNGPYAVQAAFLGWSISQCRSCSEAGKNAMRLALSTAQGRSSGSGLPMVLADITPELDP